VRIFLAIVAASATIASAQTTRLDVLFTAETGFQPLPCDCPEHPLGGWGQRAALFDSLRSAAPVPILTVDAGGFLSGNLSRGLVELTLAATAEMRYDVINLGPVDLAALEKIPDAEALSSLPFVCGRPSCPPAIPHHRVIRRSGRSIGVVGVAWFRGDVISPLEQVNRAVEAMPEIDALVVLCASGAAVARTIATERSDVDVVVAGEGLRSATLIAQGSTCIVGAGTRGRYVGRLAFDWTRDCPAEGGLSLIPVRASLAGPERVTDLAVRAAVLHEGSEDALLKQRFAYRE
jgi:2',3'-cyclic-nucleotide 2'-phosphodiesterase (5'-nucleotidase family)